MQMMNQSHEEFAAILRAAAVSAMTLVLFLAAACSKPEPDSITRPADDGFPITVIDGIRWPTAELVKVAIVDNDASLEPATSQTPRISFSVFSPVERLEEVVAKRLVLGEILRAEMADSVIDRQLCAESPWLIKGDHSEISARTNFSASRLIHVTNEAIGANLVFGFVCDLE